MGVSEVVEGTCVEVDVGIVGAAEEDEEEEEEDVEGTEKSEGNTSLIIFIGKPGKFPVFDV